MNFNSKSGLLYFKVRNSSLLFFSRKLQGMDQSSTYTTGSNDQERIPRSKFQLQKNMSGLELDDISTLTLLLTTLHITSRKSVPLFNFPKGHELTHLKSGYCSFSIGGQKQLWKVGWRSGHVHLCLPQSCRMHQ